MFRLAVELGCVGGASEIEARLSSRQIAAWQDYDRVEPIGGVRYQLALLNHGLRSMLAKHGWRDAKGQQITPGRVGRWDFTPADIEGTASPSQSLAEAKSIFLTACSQARGARLEAGGWRLEEEKTTCTT